MENLPVAVFDSGIGGLTVLKEIIRLLPSENLIYLGDTARVPYGVRSETVIKNFASELITFIMKHKVKAIVIACNTMSAVAADTIKANSTIPVIDVINPTVEEAVRSSKKRKIGVIGTRATIQSTIYSKKIKALSKGSKIIEQACPMFVPLVEEGFLNDQVTKLIAKKYLSKITASNIDLLILGCTHYPLLKGVIQDIVGSKVEIIDSAKPTAKKLKDLLKTKRLLNNGASKKKYKFFLTDLSEESYKIAQIIFNQKFPSKFIKADLF